MGPVKITRGWIFVATASVSFLAFLGCGWFVLDRAGQSKRLKRLGMDVSGYEPHPLHEPIRDFLFERAGLSPHQIERIENGLWLFAESYGIQDNSRSSMTPEEKQEIIEVLRGWPISRATGLDFRGLPIDDTDFRRLGELPILETLWLGGPHLTDEVVPMIAEQAPRLKELWIFEGSAIEGIRFDQLRHIEAAGSTGGGFRLNLSSLPIRDSAIRQIAEHCPGITSLFLANPALTGAGLDRIGTLSQLEDLTIGGSRFPGGGSRFGTLATLKNLERLHLFEGPEDGVRSLLDSTMPNLEHLTISSFPLTHRDLEKIPVFAPNLISLTLSKCKVRNESIETLLSLKKLDELNLSYNSTITDEAESVLKRFGGITIWVYGCSMSPATIATIERRP